MANFVPYAELSDEQKALVDDDNYWHRSSAARKGWGLDKLIGDESCAVRAAVAEQGYGLNLLVNDPRWQTRIEVARQGYGLDKLVKDVSPKVREATMMSIVQKFPNLEEWVKANPDKCALSKNCDKQSSLVEWQEQTNKEERLDGQPVEISLGYLNKRWVAGLTNFIPYADLTDELRAFVDSENWRDRSLAASRGLGLDKLVDDEDIRVLYGVAYNKYGLDKLWGDCTDVYSPVRVEVERALDGQSIEEWIAKNPGMCALPENRDKQPSLSDRQEQARNQVSQDAVGGKDEPAQAPGGDGLR